MSSGVIHNGSRIRHSLRMRAHTNQAVQIRVIQAVQIRVISSPMTTIFH
jgi:hypothetical protein